MPAIHRTAPIPDAHPIAAPGISPGKGAAPWPVAPTPPLMVNPLGSALGVSVGLGLPWGSGTGTSPHLPRLPPSRSEPSGFLSPGRCPADAQPTEAETVVWNQVNAVLEESQGVLAELQSYTGAGQEIREVGAAPAPLFSP